MDLISPKIEIEISVSFAETYITQLDYDLKYRICHNLWLLLFIETYHLLNADFDV